jgi:hypothetical protein
MVNDQDTQHHLTKFILEDVRQFQISFGLLERFYEKLVMKGWQNGVMGQSLNEALVILEQEYSDERSL